MRNKRECSKGSSRQFHSLLYMGSKGFFPMFEQQWLSDIVKKDTPIEPIAEKEGWRILERLGRHRDPNRKKKILQNLPAEKREIAIRLFLQLVEEKLNQCRGVIQ